MKYLFLTITQKQNKRDFLSFPNTNLRVFLVTGETFVHLEDRGLHQVHADLTVLVEEVCHRSLHRTLPHLAGLAVAVGQD